MKGDLLGFSVKTAVYNNSDTESEENENIVLNGKADNN